jgi:hypothetical protein
MAIDHPRVLQLLNRDGFFNSGSVLDSAIYPVNKLSANIENFVPLREVMDINVGLFMW